MRYRQSERIKLVCGMSPAGTAGGLCGAPERAEGHGWDAVRAACAAGRAAPATRRCRSVLTPSCHALAGPSLALSRCLSCSARFSCIRRNLLHVERSRWLHGTLAGYLLGNLWQALRLPRCRMQSPGALLQWHPGGQPRCRWQSLARERPGWNEPLPPSPPPSQVSSLSLCCTSSYACQCRPCMYMFCRLSYNHASSSCHQLLCKPHCCLAPKIHVCG